MASLAVGYFSPLARSRQDQSWLNQIDHYVSSFARLITHIYIDWMTKRVDPRLFNNFVDANFWDSSGIPNEDTSMQEILDFAEREEVTLILPFSVKAEVDHPNTPPEIKCLAARMIYTLQTNLTPDERKIRTKLQTLIQGNARAGKHDRDVYHLFEAEEYGGGYFITKDDRLLRKSEEVERLLSSLRIVSPSTFMKYWTCTAKVESYLLT